MVALGVLSLGLVEAVSVLLPAYLTYGAIGAGAFLSLMSCYACVGAMWYRRTWAKLLLVYVNRGTVQRCNHHRIVSHDLASWTQYAMLCLAAQLLLNCAHSDTASM